MLMTETSLLNSFCWLVYFLEMAKLVCSCFMCEWLAVSHTQYFGLLYLSIFYHVYVDNFDLFSAYCVWIFLV